MKGFLVIVGIILLIIFFSSTNNNQNNSSEDYQYDNQVQDSSYDYEEPDYGIPDETVTSDNWECTGDCSGHEAGYNWALDNGITDPYDCGGKSNSFIEGCEAYANEQAIEEDYSGDYEYDYSY